MSYFSHRATAPFNKSGWNCKGVFSWIKQRCGGWWRSRTASIARCKDVLRTCRPPASGCPSAERWENTDPSYKRMLKDYLASAVNMQTDQCRRRTAAEVAVSMAMTLCCFNGLTYELQMGGKDSTKQLLSSVTAVCNANLLAVSVQIRSLTLDSELSKSSTDAVEILTKII